jgi:hypothetical protein
MKKFNPNHDTERRVWTGIILACVIVSALLEIFYDPCADFGTRSAIQQCEKTLND